MEGTMASSQTAPESDAHDGPVLGRGLRNLGNTCYANSVVQALFAMDSVRGAVLASARIPTVATTARPGGSEAAGENIAVSASTIGLTLHDLLKVERIHAALEGTVLSTGPKKDGKNVPPRQANVRDFVTEYIHTETCTCAGDPACINRKLSRESYSRSTIGTMKYGNNTSRPNNPVSLQNPAVPPQTKATSAVNVKTTVNTDDTDPQTVQTPTLLDELGLLFFQLQTGKDYIEIKAPVDEESAKVTDRQTSPLTMKITTDNSKTEDTVERKEPIVEENNNEPLVVTSQETATIENPDASTTASATSAKENSKPVENLKCKDPLRLIEKGFNLKTNLLPNRTSSRNLPFSFPLFSSSSAASSTSTSSSNNNNTTGTNTESKPEESTATNSKTTCINPIRFLSKLWHDNQSFANTSMHHDAHEMLNFSLNSISETICERKKTFISAYFNWYTSIWSEEDENVDVETRDSILSQIESFRYNELSKINECETWVHKLFRGYLSNETRCLTCDASSSREEAYIDLSLEIEPSSSVMDCLAQFESCEYLTRRNKFFCGRCNSLQEAEKKLCIDSLPNVLVIHLKRFKYVFGEEEPEEPPIDIQPPVDTSNDNNKRKINMAVARPYNKTIPTSSTQPDPTSPTTTPSTSSKSSFESSSSPSILSKSTEAQTPPRVSSPPHASNPPPTIALNNQLHPTNLESDFDHVAMKQISMSSSAASSSKSMTPTTMLDSNNPDSKLIRPSSAISVTSINSNSTTSTLTSPPSPKMMVTANGKMVSTSIVNPYKPPSIPHTVHTPPVGLIASHNTRAIYSAVATTYDPSNNYPTKSNGGASTISDRGQPNQKVVNGLLRGVPAMGHGPSNGNSKSSVVTTNDYSGNIRQSKLMYKVSIPVKLSPTAIGQDRHYTLQSIVFHVGRNANQGHYVAVTRTVKNTGSNKTTTKDQQEPKEEWTVGISAENPEESDDVHVHRIDHETSWILLDDTLVRPLTKDEVARYCNIPADDYLTTSSTSTSTASSAEKNSDTISSSSNSSASGSSLQTTAQVAAVSGVATPDSCMTPSPSNGSPAIPTRNIALANVAKTSSSNPPPKSLPPWFENATGYIVIYRAVDFDVTPTEFDTKTTPIELAL